MEVFVKVKVKDYNGYQHMNNTFKIGIRIKDNSGKSTTEETVNENHLGYYSSYPQL